MDKEEFAKIFFKPHPIVVGVPTKDISDDELYTACFIAAGMFVFANDKLTLDNQIQMAGQSIGFLAKNDNFVLKTGFGQIAAWKSRGADGTEVQVNPASFRTVTGEPYSGQSPDLNGKTGFKAQTLYEVYDKLDSHDLRALKLTRKEITEAFVPAIRALSSFYVDASVARINAIGALVILYSTMKRFNAADIRIELNGATHLDVPIGDYVLSVSDKPVQDTLVDFPDPGDVASGVVGDKKSMENLRDFMNDGVITNMTQTFQQDENGIQKLKSIQATEKPKYKN